MIILPLYNKISFFQYSSPSFFSRFFKIKKNLNFFQFYLSWPQNWVSLDLPMHPTLISFNYHMRAHLIDYELSNLIFILQGDAICSAISNHFILFSDLAILEINVLYRWCLRLVLIFNQDIRVEFEVK